MITLRTAAQQALEALEAFLSDELRPHEAAKSSAALKAALAQQAEPLNLRDPAVQKRLATQWGYVPAAQAEPVEPVAYIHWQGNYWDTSERHLTDDEKARGWTEEPLYTAPPQRKPLTEEEIVDAVRDRP